MTVGGGVLKIEDIEPHWRFDGSAVGLPINPSGATSEATSESSDAEMNYDIPTSLSDLSNPLLEVQNPAVIRLKGRPVEARGRRGVKRQQEFEDYTQRGVYG